MRYPVVTLPAAQEFLLSRREGKLLNLAVEYRGTGSDDCFDDIQGVLEDMVESWEQSDLLEITTGPQKDVLEGELSIELHGGLRSLPVEVLTDRDFWRFLSTYYLFDFIEWRDGRHCGLASFGAGGNSPSWDCVPLRMFNRALIAEAGGIAAKEEDIYWGARVGGTDLWRSHILRVLNGYAPIMVNEILHDAKAGKLPTNVLREFAKGLKRSRANVLFEVLDPGQAREFVNLQRERAVSALDFES